MRRCGLLVFLSIAACGGSGGRPDSGTPDSGSSDAGITCSVTFTHRALASASTVYVTGEWNGFARQTQPMADPTGSGTWTGTFNLPPGHWAYRFLENGADVLDPNPHDVRYIDGNPVPALTVADCSKPILTVKSFTNTPGAQAFSATISVSGASDVTGTLRSSDPERPLTSSELTLSADKTTATVTLSGLTNGKYTVVLNGGALLLPFWIEAEHFDFRDSPLYMAMIDRFRDGDTTNNSAGAASPAGNFHGGDLQGLKASINEGYFDALAIKAIWVSPWQTQPQDVFPAADGVHTVSGYHGYWPVKAREVDARFGGNDALHAMVSEAHRHGIRIVMDLAINQVHQEHEYFQDPAKAAWFRPATGKTQGPGCLCGSSQDCDWNSPARVFCLFAPFMPDINWTNNDASDQFISDALWWMETFDLDGIRMDAVKHVENACITNLTGKVRDRFETAGTKIYMFGESFTGDVGLINSYNGPNGLDGALDFPMFFSVPEPVFGDDANGLQLVQGQTHQTLSDFPTETMVTFIGNQDLARFITKADPANRNQQGNQWDNLPGAPQGQQPYDRLYQAFESLMTTPGVPLIYYGDEYGEFGGGDPDNRHTMNRAPTLWPEQQNQLSRMQTLLKARASLRGVRRGRYVDVWCNTDQWGAGQGSLMEYARLDDSDPRQSAVVLLNLTYNDWTNVDVNFPTETGWTSGTLNDALSNADYPFTGPHVNVTVPARGAAILHLK
jgi:glycosidase